MALLSYYLEAFEKFIRRNKLIRKDIKNRQLAFVKYTKKLLSVSKKGNMDIKKLKQKLSEDTNGVSGKLWLQQKISELLKPVSESF